MSREPSYAGPVYSLTVEGDHTYVGDGLVTHNCADVERIVTEVVSPNQRAALKLSDDIVEFANGVAEVVALDPDKRGKLPNELFNKAKRMRAEIDKTIPTLSGRARRTVEDADRTFVAAHFSLLEECFAMSEEMIAVLKGMP